jgi:hypothetical protein
VPLDPQGDDFQRRVWRALGEIPAGATETYASVARRVGAPRAASIASTCGTASVESAAASATPPASSFTMPLERPRAKSAAGS